jgi:hypothetical protein
MKVVKAVTSEVTGIISNAAKNYGLTQNRTGIHATDCIYCLRKAWFSKQTSTSILSRPQQGIADVSALPPTPDELLYYLLGLGTQTALLGKDNPDAIEEEGIYLSPDYWNHKTQTLAELKTTRMGKAKLDAGQFPEGWMKQLKCYCYALKVNTAILLVIPIIQPEILSYIVAFDPAEIESNWLWIRDRVNILKASFKSNSIPEVKGEEWECKGCRYGLRCKVFDSTPKIPTPESIRTALMQNTINQDVKLSDLI